MTFGTTMTAELSALRAGSTLPPRKFLWNHFLLEAEWTPDYLNADTKIRSLKNFQGPHLELNPGRPVL